MLLLSKKCIKNGRSNSTHTHTRNNFNYSSFTSSNLLHKIRCMHIIRLKYLVSAQKGMVMFPVDYSFACRVCLSRGPHHLRNWPRRRRVPIYSYSLNGLHSTPPPSPRPRNNFVVLVRHIYAQNVSFRSDHSFRSHANVSVAERLAFHVA